MFTPEMISLTITLVALTKALVELITPFVKLFCHWRELELNKRYDVN
ncbi:hypothetical protein [Citrobacter werkmanii]|nr:hypothetical protein [Citrobacter werkmanii]MBY6245146.1 hypothetical protein [Citrobacter werkmanii]MBY6251959.1 hypothetical protein [Citrobacter werkmanii]